MPIATGPVFAQAESDAAIVFELGHFVGEFSGQHIDDVDRAKALPRGANGCENVSGFGGAVDFLNGLGADIAVAARFAELTEVSEQGLTSAIRCFAIGHQCIKAFVFAALAFGFGPCFLVDEHAAHADVLQPEQHMGFRRFTIPAGAANLLVIRVEV